MKSRSANLRLVQSDVFDPREESLDFDALFVKYSPYAARIAFRIMGHGDEVDDIVQDVFIEVHRGLALLQSAQHVKGWVATITVRTCSRRLRIKKIQRMLMPGFVALSEPEAFEVPKEGLSPEEELWLKAVYAALDTMSIAYRVAWTLRYIQGERLEDVAKICKCSLATVKRRIAHAHQMIRKVVGDE